VATDHLVDVDGDTRIRANLTAMHAWAVEESDPRWLETYFLAGGVLRALAKCTHEGWRLSELELQKLWRVGWTPCSSLSGVGFSAAGNCCRGVFGEPRASRLSLVVMSESDRRSGCMKRLLLSLLTLVALAIFWQAASADDPVGMPGPLADPARPVAPSPPEGKRFEDEHWVVRSVSADGRVLVVQGRGGPCGHDARAIVTETASAVRIRVLQLVPADLSHIRCVAYPRIDVLRVRLSAPIAGRAVIGQSLGTATVGLAGRPIVPRMVGLRVADARFALRAQGFRVRGNPRGVVRGQLPRPQTPVKAAPITVTLLAR
jgi:hypothetical protein